MTDEIKPALTPEQWKSALAPHSQHADHSFVLPDTSGVPIVIKHAARHAAAALALYQQPFGFTREDVELLRGATRDAALIDDDDARPFAELADRIEALLPPEHV